MVKNGVLYLKLPWQVLFLAAVLLIWFKPEREKLAWGLAVGGWLMTVLIYVGHVSTGILGVLNL